MNSINQYIKKLDLDISEENFIRVLFDVFKFADKELTNLIGDYQKKTTRVYDSSERKKLRKRFYYGNTNLINFKEFDDFVVFKYDEIAKKSLWEQFHFRLKNYDEQSILLSIKTRINLLSASNNDLGKAKEWINYYQEKHKNTPYSAIIIKFNTNIYEQLNGDALNQLFQQSFDNLVNYRYLFIVYEGEILSDSKNITWSLIFKNILELENLRQYKDSFFPFKKEKKITELKNFLRSRFPIDEKEASEISSNFYSSIAYGFKFEDLLIKSNNNEKILIMRKVQHDLSQVPCPSCLSNQGKSNSYPELFVKSFECSNPQCPDRSKSGRGKRYDEYGTYRYFQMMQNSIEDNRIDFDTYYQWRRDIFESKDSLDMISQFYTWENEKIGLYNTNWSKLKTNRIYSEIEIDKKTLTSSFEKTNLYRFFEKISEFKNEETKVIKLTREIELFNADSSLEINKLKLDQIGCAITSPPYYNAREYSQWGNILFYLIDMQINAQSIFNKIDNNGAYLYNIGDINGNDNLYVDSNMSNRRLPLGAYTYLIFSIIGWNVNGNIIWDKGQVQSKRNSTINLFAGYIRPINSYEHIMIFQKTPTSKNLSYIKQLSPVIKINSKGVNTYKHTAPYPIQIVDTVESFLIPGKYLLDPFLGSGTTLIWCKNKKIKGVGFELNKTYYELAVSRIFNTDVYSNIGLFD